MNTMTAIAPSQTLPHLARAVWMPWTGRSWPATTSEEHEFAERLAELAPPRQGNYRRSDVTAVLNALRCGISVDELLERTPGLQVGLLLDAYRALESKRHTSALAWQAIVAEPNLRAFTDHAMSAALLLPAPITGLRAVAELQPRSLAEAVEEVAERVAAAQERVRRVERALDFCIPPSDRGAELGRRLYDPVAGGETSHPDHLPERVGTLVPTRVAALLGERVDVSKAIGAG